MNISDIPIIVHDWMPENTAVLCDGRIFSDQLLFRRLVEHPQSADEILQHAVILKLEAPDQMDWPLDAWLSKGYVPTSESRSCGKPRRG